MKKQLLMLALTLGFVATADCKKKQKTTTIQPDTSVTVISKNKPIGSNITVVPFIGNKKKKTKNKWIVKNTGTASVTIKTKQ